MEIQERRSIPTRADIEQRWLSLIQGRVSRNELHEWASAWVEQDDGEVVDPMVLNGLQHLHGFDMTYDSEDRGKVRHGPGERYVHSEADISGGLSRWRINCAAYDTDPAAYLQCARNRALSQSGIGDE